MVVQQREERGLQRCHQDQPHHKKGPASAHRRMISAGLQRFGCARFCPQWPHSHRHGAAVPAGTTSSRSFAGIGSAMRRKMRHAPTSLKARFDVFVIPEGWFFFFSLHEGERRT